MAPRATASLPVGMILSLSSGEYSISNWYTSLCPWTWSWPIWIALLFASMMADLPLKVSAMTPFMISGSRPMRAEAAPRATVFIIIGVPPISSTMPLRGTG